MAQLVVKTLNEKIRPAVLTLHREKSLVAVCIEISWWVFALAGGLALVIALLPVSTQAIRAALANPVESLRYE